jgi:hypothetical protein
MLCWAMEQRASPKRLNVHVLTEMTLEYFRLERSRIHSRLDQALAPGPRPAAPGRRVRAARNHRHPPH